MKSEKDTRPHHISIPPKDAIAIVPPKKVSHRDVATQCPAQMALDAGGGLFAPL
jgi:hypothetical protein